MATKFYSVKSFALAGAAALLSGTFLSSAALAQSYGSGPQYSTPAERAQTRELNARQAAKATNTYEAQVDYNEDRAQYREDKREYRQQRAQYNHEMAKYDRAEWAFTDYPKPYPYRYGDHKLRKLYLIAQPTAQLAQAPIEGPDGNWVGKVRNVETDVDGRPRRIEVFLNSRVSVWVRPEHFRFDATDKILFTDLTREELWARPGATITSDHSM